MAFDPTLPAAHTPMASSTLRAQFNGLAALLAARAWEDDCVNRQLACAINPAAVESLMLTVSDPPTQYEMQAVLDKLNEVLMALKRPIP